MIFNKPLVEVTAEDVRALKELGFRESVNLDYKVALSLDGNAKREFAKDVSAFANTAGGMLIYGVTEVDGLPEAFPGVELPNVDRFEQSVSQILRSNVDPVMPNVSLQLVPDGERYFVLVSVNGRSWVAPHWVRSRGADAGGKFHIRHGVRSLPMSIGEVRAAFGASLGLRQAITEFRGDRISAIVSGRTPVPLRGHRRTIIHIGATQSFSGEHSVDLVALRDRVRDDGSIKAALKPPGVLPAHDPELAYTFCFEGLAYYPPGFSAESACYVQIFRHGAIEAVGQLWEPEGRTLTPQIVTQQVTAQVTRYHRLARQLGVGYPILAMLTVLGYGWGEGRSDEVLQFPAVIFESEEDVSSGVKPLLLHIAHSMGSDGSYSV